MLPMIGRTQQGLRAALPATWLLCAPAHADQLHLYLQCTGTLSSPAKPAPEQLDLAMRGNNLTVLIQKLNVLPVGERLKYVATAQACTMQVRTPVHGTQEHYFSWFHGPLFVWHPDLKNLTLMRRSIDRQSAKLAGEMLNIAGKVLGRLSLTCKPQSMDEVAKPKF